MNDEKAIICEQEFDSTVLRLWRAITDVEEMRQWFFDSIPDFKAEVGFETRFMVDAGERQFMHEWKIIEVQYLKLIKYQWTYEDYNGIGFVTFQISVDNERIMLKVISEGLDTFRPKVPEFSRENCQGGWDYFIKERLKCYLAKQ